MLQNFLFYIFPAVAPRSTLPLWLSRGDAGRWNLFPFTGAVFGSGALQRGRCISTSMRSFREV